MVSPIRILAAFATALFVSACAPSGPSSSGPDEWGHRPGPKGFRTVIIDAGHGGNDPGAVSRHTGQREKDLVLDWATRLQAELRGDFRVIMMRSDDTFVDRCQDFAFCWRPMKEPLGWTGGRGNGG